MNFNKRVKRIEKIRKKIEKGEWKNIYMKKIINVIKWMKKIVNLLNHSRINLIYLFKCII